MSTSRGLPTIYSRSGLVTSMGHQGPNSFVRVAEIFTVPNSYKLCPKHFPEGEILQGLCSPDCEPEWAINLVWKQL